MRLCHACGRLSDDSAATCPVDGKELSAYTTSLAAGETVAEKYKIGLPLGAGQSGEVYEAKEEGTGDRVIVRVLSEEVCKDRRLSDVVRRHLLKQKDFDHKYVVRIRAVDVRNERLLVVRNWVDGERLEDVLLRETVLPVRRALDLAVRICTALAEAHKVGLLHLQLRASNVFVVPGEAGGESVRLVDFGIGPRHKVANRPVYGQPSTLSPEQIEGKIVSFKSDMFSAGLLLYRMLAGNLPWTGAEDAIVRQILEAPVPPIKYRAESPVPMELWGFIRQTLEKKPIHRPIGMAQMADRLRELEGDAVAGRLSVEPPPPPGEAAVVEAGAAPTPPPRTPDRTAIGKIALKQKGTAPLPAAGPKAVPKEEAAIDQAIEIPGLPAAGGDGPGVDIDVGQAEPAAKAVEPEATAPKMEPLPTQPKEDLAVAKPGKPKAHEGAAPDRPKADAPVADESSGAGKTKKPPPGAPDVGVKPLLRPKRDEARPASSSDTMPMEPDIIEEAMVPPPLRVPKSGPRITTARPGEAVGRAYKRGLVHGLGAGLAVAVILFFCAMYLFRPKGPATPSGGRDGEVAAVQDGGPPRTALTAEGPMQVTALGGDASVTPDSRPAAPVDGDSPSDVGAETPGPPSVDAGSATPEPVPADAGAARDAALLPAADATITTDPGRTPDAGTRPTVDSRATERTDTGPRTDTTPADAARADAGATGADSMARANELVAQGDQALAGRDFAAARAAYEEALQVQSNNNRAKIGLGRVAFQQGNFEEAVRYLEPVYRNQGNMDLGVAYVRLGRLPDAQRQFEKLVERNPNNTDAQRALEAVRRQLGP